jgi:hypothetical protein
MTSRTISTLAGLWLLAAAPAAHAQGKPEVYNATAELKTPAGGSVSTPVVITIERWTPDAERDAVRAAVKAGTAQKHLAGLASAGTLQIGAVKTPLRFARALPVGGGKVVTAATAEPVFHVGAGAPGAKPKAGYDVAVVIFEVNAAGAGDAGDLAPAAKVKFDANGGLVVEDYGVEAVRLMKITRK